MEKNTLYNIYVCRVCLFTQLCLILCDPIDCSLPGPSVSGISQARVLEWVAIYIVWCVSHSGVSNSLPRDGGAWWAAVYGVAQSQTRLTEVT